MTRDIARNPAIAIVDDDEPIRLILSELLVDEGYAVAAWDGMEDPLAFVNRVQPAVTLLDLHLSGWASSSSAADALRIIEELQKVGSDVIICTADAAFLREHGDELERMSCAAVAKPFDLDDLLAHIARCLNLSGSLGR